jgi:hypothetical protein
MQSNGKSLALACGVCVMALACDERAREPVVPNAVSSAVSPAAAIAELSSIGGAKASGHADIHATLVQNVRDETYSFTALSTGTFPLAKGQVQVHFLQFTGEKFTVHAEVTCLSIVGNEAWVGSLVTRYVIDGQEQPERVGGPMIFRVQDTGEGHGATDLASLVFFGAAPGGDLAHCNTQPPFPIMRESTNGTIQVKPD